MCLHSLHVFVHLGQFLIEGLTVDMMRRKRHALSIGNLPSAFSCHAAVTLCKVFSRTAMMSSHRPFNAPAGHEQALSPQRQPCEATDGKKHRQIGYMYIMFLMIFFASKKGQKVGVYSNWGSYCSYVLFPFHSGIFLSRSRAE